MDSPGFTAALTSTLQEDQGRGTDGALPPVETQLLCRGRSSLIFMSRLSLSVRRLSDMSAYTTSRSKNF